MWFAALGLAIAVVWLAHKTNGMTQGKQGLPEDKSVASSGIGGPMSPATAGGAATIARSNRLVVSTNAGNVENKGLIVPKYAPVKTGVYVFQAGPTDAQRAVATQQGTPPVSTGIPIGSKTRYLKL